MDFPNNDKQKRELYAFILGTLSYSTFIDLMNDFYYDLIDNFNKDDIDKYWNYEGIKNALIVDKFDGAEFISEVLINIGNNSTFNDILVDQTEGILTVKRLANVIMKNI